MCLRILSCFAVLAVALREQSVSDMSEANKNFVSFDVNTTTF